MTVKEIKNMQKPWITKEIIKKIKIRDKVHKEYIKNLAKSEGSEAEKRKIEELRSQYKMHRNQITSAIRASERQWFKDYFTRNTGCYNIQIAP